MLLSLGSIPTYRIHGGWEVVNYESSLVWGIEDMGKELEKDGEG
jgi:hypothetical protein